MRIPACPWPESFALSSYQVLLQIAPRTHKGLRKYMVCGVLDLIQMSLLDQTPKFEFREIIPN